MLKKMRENKKGGFTLVELIIVLVILAVLAAFLVPTLTGYVKKADDKSLVSETRLLVMAAQTYADELYAIDRDVTQDDIDEVKADILILAELPASPTTFTITCDSASGKITGLTYQPTSTSKTCTYNPNDSEKYSVN